MKNISFDTIQIDIELAILSLDGVKRHVPEDVKVSVCFHIHQACKDLIKLQLYLSNSNIPNNEVNTDDILSLHNVAIKYGIPIVLSPYLIKYTNMLSDWGNKSYFIRYSTPNVGMIKKCLNELKLVFNRVLQIHTGNSAEFGVLLNFK